MYCLQQVIQILYRIPLVVICWVFSHGDHTVINSKMHKIMKYMQEETLYHLKPSSSSSNFKDKVRPIVASPAINLAH